MKKITSLLLTTLVISHSLTACNSQVPVEPVVEQEVVQQDVSAMSSVTDIDKVFKSLDFDKDGKVSLKEYNKIMNTLSPFAKDKSKFTATVNKAFQNMDADKNQMLDKKEFANIEKELKTDSDPSVQKNSASSSVNPKVIKATFDMLRDSDEEISDRAFIKFLSEQNGVPSQDAMKVFVLLDKSKNGRLDLKEFSKLFDKTNSSFFKDNSGIAGAVVFSALAFVYFLYGSLLWLVDKIGLIDIK